MAHATEKLSDSAAQVLRLLISGDHLSRPELTSLLRVSAPTVTTALGELIETGFVAQAGSRQGKLGRAAGLYALDSRTGWLLGIDVGSTQILIVARSLDGSLLSDFHYSAADAAERGKPKKLLTAVAFEQVARLLSELSSDHGELRAIGIAIAHVVPNSASTESMIGIGDEAVRLGDILDDLGLPAAVPVLLENNVNCAALAEMSLGIAQSVNNFAYLQIGVRLGSGLVIDGKLRRGSNGGSGELSQLPFPMEPYSDGREQSFLLEKHLGSEQLLKRATSRWRSEDGPPPATSKHLFDLAGQGVPAALDAVTSYAREIAHLSMVLCAVLDPELVVLGGGVGQNPLLARLVKEYLLKEYPKVRLETSALGERATVEGATALATEHARTSLLGNHYATILSAKGHIVSR